MAKGKKMTPKQMRLIVKTARGIREHAGSRNITVKKYNMKWCEAIKRGAKQVLHPARQTRIRFSTKK